LSDDAVQPIVTDDCVINVAARPDGVLGGVVSGQPPVVAVIVVFADRLPAASNASTATVYDVPHERPLRA
jgi:hypothetical protein